METLSNLHLSISVHKSKGRKVSINMVLLLRFLLAVCRIRRERKLAFQTEAASEKFGAHASLVLPAAPLQPLCRIATVVSQGKC